MGRRSAHSARTSEPSPLTTISGTPRPRAASVSRSVPMSSRSKGTSRALRATVVARRTELRRVVSSWPQVTGKFVSSSIISRARISWAGLRTPK